MPDILSREEFDRCNPLPEGRPTVVWQSHLEAQAATIEALAEALRFADTYICDRGGGDFDYHDTVDPLREKGWLTPMEADE